MERGNHYVDKCGQIQSHSLDTSDCYLDRGRHEHLLLGQGWTRVVVLSIGVVAIQLIHGQS
jgi:hypothetical protein